jgi:oligopeptide transport system permease protein
MLRFLVSRLVQGFIVVQVVLVLSFVLLKMAPGGPFDREKKLPDHLQALLESQLGLDKPMPVQVAKHLWNFNTLNWPPSYRYKDRSVAEIIRTGFPISAAVGLPALLIAIGIGVPMGALAALRAHRWEDQVAMGAAAVGVCTPSMVLGPTIALLFGLKLHWFNVGGWESSSDWVLPACTLGLIYAAYVARITRGGLRETLSQDFIRTARAKGVNETSIVRRHALRLACLPLLNFLGPAAAGLLTGSFITETVFFIPGLGQHFIASAVNKDYFLASYIAAFYAVMIVGFNLVVDVLQALVNPRIGFKS